MNIFLHLNCIKLIQLILTCKNILIPCSQTEFLGANSNDYGSKSELVAALNNGKGLSLYFPGITHTVSAKGEFKKTLNIEIDVEKHTIT